MDNNTVTRRETSNPFGVKGNTGAANKKPLKNPFGNINVYDDPVVDLQPRNSGSGGSQGNVVKTPFGSSGNRQSDDDLQGNINLRMDNTRRSPFENQQSSEVNIGYGGRDDSYSNQQQMYQQRNNPYGQPTGNYPQENPSLISSINPGSIFTSFLSSAFGGQQAGGQGTQQQQQQDFYDEDNEPPLLEDLGIDLELIKQRALSVVKFQKIDERFVIEADMSGPLLLALLFGSLQLLAGKVHFGYIYGFGVIGTVGIYMIINLLNQLGRVQLYNTMSILGYCLCPIVLLSAINVFLNLRNIFGFVLAAGAIAWATIAATNFFEVALRLDHRKWLIAYPIFLFYLVFVLITIF